MIHKILSINLSRLFGNGNTKLLQQIDDLNEIIDNNNLRWERRLKAQNLTLIAGYTDKINNLNEQIKSLESQLATLAKQYSLDLLNRQSQWLADSKKELGKLQEQHDQKVKQLEDEITQLKLKLAQDDQLDYLQKEKEQLEAQFKAEIKTLRQQSQAALDSVERKAITQLNERDHVISQLRGKLESMTDAQEKDTTESTPTVVEELSNTYKPENSKSSIEQSVPYCPSCGTTKLKSRGYYKGNRRYECLNQDCKKKTFTFKG